MGDTHIACTCKLQYCADMLWAGGANLTILREKTSEACTFIKQHEHKTVLGLVLILQRSVDILIGSETRKLTMNELSDLVKDNLGPRHKMIIGFHNLYLSLVFNDGTLHESCEAFFQAEMKSSCFLMSADSVQAYCAGLACFQVRISSHVWHHSAPSDYCNWTNHISL